MIDRKVRRLLSDVKGKAVVADRRRQKLAADLARTSIC